ncbi:MAG: ATP-binding protein [Coleofasciculus sp. G3-WIS-01]|uniref:ATP-binding response regulator n=1 Tax=Coleofasciculus sp. G3-WIS-01 TaxID=3069528 RepID=UPI00330037FC
MKLRQVLINLMGNAIKFTASGMVSVKVKCNEKKEASHSLDSRANTINTNAASSQVDTTILSFEVQDTGVGIAEEEIDNLFQPFVQTKSGQRVQQGTGLGLTISRKFVRLMGGDITVISQTVGAKHSRPNISVFYQRHAANASPNPQSPIPNSTSGTTFKFHIPVRIGDAIASDNQSQSRYVIALAPNQPQYRILVVDDREYNRQLLIKLLKPLGFDVQEAINGQQALDMWDSYSPHLIWMDMRMPIMDGYEATKQIKSTTKGQATAVIALTASVWEEEKAVILSAGCDDFVRKPFQKDVIFEIMAKHLGVGYLYQEKALPSRPTDGTGESLNFHGLFAAMSKPWIVKLHDAALDADSKLVYKILKDVPESYAFERETLRNWVKQFEFEKILDLTEQ